MIGVSHIGIAAYRGGGGGAYDSDALAFISAWESATAVAMGAAQKEVVNTTVRMLKGDGTTNGNNIWSLLASTNSVILPFVPKDDTDAYLQGYAIDLLSASSVVTWVNFLPTDSTVTGMSGNGANKYGILSISPNDLPQDNVCIGYYPITNSSVNNRAFGTNRMYASTVNSVGSQPVAINSSGNVGFTGSAATSEMSTYVRTNSGSIQLYRSGTFIQSIGLASTTRETISIFLYALNTGSGIFRPTTDKFAGFHFTEGMAADQIADFHEAMQYLNDNIITGGR